VQYERHVAVDDQYPQYQKDANLRKSKIKINKKIYIKMTGAKIKKNEIMVGKDLD
jgi:hypothetical protein